jgi:metallo-beta-lactamase family protein
LRLTFLGAAGTVTGSKYLLEDGGEKLLIDCGLFQGLKELRLRNRGAFPADPAAIGSMLLTHAHLDHSGYLPRLAAHGFRGKVHCSAATRDLARILLLDSASLQEEEARHAARHGWSKHNPPLPLYTREEAQACERLFRPQAWHKPFHPLPGCEAVFRKAGHILGAATITVARGGRTVLFSGDLGRGKDAVLAPPDPCPGADWIVVESTYGDRRHADIDPAGALAALAEKVFARGGAVLVPSFAVGRTQSLLHLLWRLRQAGRLAHVPVFVDSPMATDVTRLYLDHPSDHNLGPELAREVFGAATYVRTPEESKRLSARKGPMILISASGMATGGRILHHLKAFAPNPANAVLLAGFQAEGTRGAKLAAGDRTIRIFGEMVPVNAEVATLPNASAHADADEILAWLKTAPRRPERVFVTHGEPSASEALRARIAAELGWDAHVPRLGESAEPGAGAAPA